MSGFLIKPCNVVEPAVVRANTPIDGDGTSLSPLSINTQALAGQLVDGVTTTVVNGKIQAAAGTGGAGGVINNTIAASVSSPLTGNGTAANPIGVNTTALASQLATQLVDGSTITVNAQGKLQSHATGGTGNITNTVAAVTDAATITGNGTTTNPLKVNPQALVDGSTITVNAQGKLQSNATGTGGTTTVAASTNSTLSGNGTVASPLGVNVASLVDGGTTTATAAGKIAVNPQALVDGSTITVNAQGKLQSNATGGTVNTTNTVAASVSAPLTGNGTSASPITVDVTALATQLADGTSVVVQGGKLKAVAPSQECVAVTDINTFAAEKTPGFTCFTASYRTTIGLPVDFPSPAITQESTTAVDASRNNVYSGYKIKTADGAIIYVYENNATGDTAAGWSKTWSGTAASKWMRETAIVPAQAQGLQEVTVNAPLTGKGTAVAPLGVDYRAIAQSIMTMLQANLTTGKLELTGTAPVAPPVTPIAPASYDRLFSFASLQAGANTATSDDGLITVTAGGTDAARAPANWEGMAVSTDKGMAIQTDIKDPTRRYTGTYIDVGNFDAVASSAASTTITFPFRIDAIGSNNIGIVTANLDTAGTAVTGGLSVQRNVDTQAISIPPSARVGVTINGVAADANTTLEIGKWYVATITRDMQFAKIRFGAPANLNGGASLTIGNGFRVTRGQTADEIRQYTAQLVAKYTA